MIPAVVLCLLSGCMLPREEELLPPDLLQPEEVNFLTVEVGRGTIQDIIEDSLIAGSSVHYEMTFYNRSGYLAELDARPGQEVKAGDILAKLDTGSLEMDIQYRSIEVEKLRLTLEELVRTGSPRFSRRMAELDLKMAELMLQQLEDELAKSTIIAPVDGEVVFLSAYKIGEFVPGRSVVLTVADPSQVQFEYSGFLTNRIKHGMEAEIMIDSGSYAAKVSMIPANAPLEERDRYANTVVFTANDPESLPDNIKLGTRYRFSIFIEEKKDVIVIPRSAVSSFMGQDYVQILDNGMRTERDLDIGITSGTQMEVLSGLEEGELLIVGINK